MKPWLVLSLAFVVIVLIIGVGFQPMQTDFEVVNSVDLKDSRGYAVADKRLWFADGNDLFYLKLAQPAATPRNILHFDAPIYVKCVAESGDRLVLSRQNLLEVYDIQEADNPKLIASFDPPGNPPSHCALRDGVLAFDSYGGGIDSQHLHIYDVSSTGEAVLLSTVMTTQGASIYDVAMLDSLILVANGWDGLTLIGNSDDRKYGIISQLKIGGYVRGVYPVGNRAYLAVSDAPRFGSEFSIVDISNPASPRKLSSCETSGGAQDVYADKNTAFLADRNGGLLALDISDETQPVVIDRYRCRCDNLSGTGGSLVLTRATRGSETALEVLTFKKQ